MRGKILTERFDFKRKITSNSQIQSQNQEKIFRKNKQRKGFNLITRVLFPHA